LLISVTIINQPVLCSIIKTSVKFEDSQHFVSRNGSSHFWDLGS